MLIIPELRKILIFVPRTGSGSLRRAVAERYPQSMLLYRHMEAGGVPLGYERWERIGVIRHPIHRLFSMWQFCRDLPHQLKVLYPEWAAAQKTAANRPFEDWMIFNDIPFPTPTSDGRRWPHFTVLHEKPETKKSQREYLIVDEGRPADAAKTTIYSFEHIDELAKSLDVQLGRYNQTAKPSFAAPLYRELAMRSRHHFDRHFAWDKEMWEELTGKELV